MSNSTWCGRKALTIVRNAEQIVAGKALTAAQALMRMAAVAKDQPIGKGTSASACRPPTTPSAP